MDQDAFGGRENASYGRAASPSSGDDLLGMEIDFVGLLGGAGGIDGTTVIAHRTTDPACLIQVECATLPADSLEAAISEVEEVWLGPLRYRYLEAHSTRVDPSEAILDFVTQINEGGFFVTGRIRVLPPSG